MMRDDDAEEWQAKYRFQQWRAYVPRRLDEEEVLSFVSWLMSGDLSYGYRLALLSLASVAQAGLQRGMTEPSIRK